MLERSRLSDQELPSSHTVCTNPSETEHYFFQLALSPIENLFKSRDVDLSINVFGVCIYIYLYEQ